MTKPKLYLAGPAVFRPDAKVFAERLKAICAEHSCEGLFPLDNGPGIDRHDKRATAKWIYTAKKVAKIGDLHFHDLRGTAATRFYNAGVPIRVIAEILGWSEEQVERIIRRYVGRQAATKALIAQINKAKGRTKTGKPTGKP